MELSFSGCGLFIIYYTGVYRALWESYGGREGILKLFHKFSGCSAGNIICGAILYKFSPDDTLELYKKHYFNCGPFGFVNPTRVFRKADLICKECLPENALDTLREDDVEVGMHLKRLTLSPPFVKDVLKTDFGSNEEMLEFAAGSYHVPVLAGSLLKRISGGCYMDGMTFNPELDEKYSILVTPSGICCALKGVPELCISPSVPLPMHWAFVPPSDAQMMNVYKLGYYDGLRFLHCNSAKIKARAPKNRGGQVKFKRVPIDWDEYFKVRVSLTSAVRRRNMCKWLMALLFMYWISRKQNAKKWLLGFVRK